MTIVEFPTVPITELFRLKQGTYLKADEMDETPSASFPYPVYGANGVIGYANRKMYPERTTLISCRGANCGVVHFTTPNVWISNNSIACVPATKLDPTFYYYVCLNTGFGDVITGSAQPQITITNLSSKRLIRPPLPVQRRIAHILSAYDELMANCQRRIRILEQMARALYREWFVYFRFPGHEKVPQVDSPLGAIPQGWEVTTLRAVTTKIGSGATPRGGKEAYKSEGIHLIRSLNIYDYSFEFENLALIDEQQAAELDNVTVTENDILLNITGASVARCALVPSYLLPARVNQHVAIVRADPAKASPFYLLDAINSDQRKQQLLALAQGGATREALTKDTVSNFEVILPQRRLMKCYDEVARGIHRQREALLRKIQNLRRTRDLLLPRLLSGQVSLDVSAVEDVAEPTALAPPLSQADLASEEPALRAAEEAPPYRVERAGRGLPPPAEPAPVPIDQIDRTEVLQVIRQVFSEGPPRERDTAIRDVARALGYRRTGPRIQEILHTELMTAVRRCILENQHGALRLCARSITDYGRDFLKQQFLAAIGRTWIDRETAVRKFCRWLGFARTGPIIQDIAGSLINGLLREGRLESDGPVLIRRV